MKHTPWKLTKLLSAIVASLAVLSSALPASAAGASISLTANHSRLSSGNTLIVAVYMNGGGTPINGVEADLNYPASKLQYIGLNYSGGAFNIATPGDGGGNGAVSIQNGAINPVSGSGLVATVTFRALSSSGSATIGVSGSSNLVSSATNLTVPFGSYGVTVSFGASSSGASLPSTPAPPAPPKDTTPPVISGIKLTDLSPFGVTVNWTTNEPSSSEVDYGLDATYGLSNSSASLTTTHAVALSSAFLTPETVFHYHVRSADAAGNVAASPDGHFSLPGVPITVVVLGANGKAEANAIVTLDGASSTTNSKGQVTLPSSLGNKQITTTFQGVTIQKPITVSRTVKPLPPYQLDLIHQPLNRWMLTSIGLVVVVLTLLGIDAVLFGSHFFARLAGIRFAPASLLPHHSDVSKVAQPLVTDVKSDSPPGTEPVKPVEEKPALSPTRPEFQPVGPATIPVTAPPNTVFNIHTTGNNPTPPTLRAIENIQPLSLRPSFASHPATAPKRIAVTETISAGPEPASLPSVTTSGMTPPAKPAPKKRLARRRRKVIKPVADASTAGSTKL